MNNFRDKAALFIVLITASISCYAHGPNDFGHNNFGRYENYADSNKAARYSPHYIRPYYRHNYYRRYEPPYRSQFSYFGSNGYNYYNWHGRGVLYDVLLLRHLNGM